MTDRLKQYIQNNKELLNTDTRKLVYGCPGLCKEELVTILTEQNITILPSDITKEDIVQALPLFAKQTGGKLNITDKGVVTYTWADGDFKQKSTLNKLTVAAKKDYLDRKTLFEDPGLLLDYFD